MIAEFPLLESQSGLWFAQRLAPQNPAFNTAHVLWIEGELHVDHFRSAVELATDETEAFLLKMRESPTPVQTLDYSHKPHLRIVDCSRSLDPKKTATELMRSDRQTPVDPTRDPLAAQSLYLLGENRFAWYVRVHHLATDGYGMALYTERVSVWYEALRKGTGPTGKPLGDLSAVADDDAKYRSSERRARDAEHWRTELTGLPEVSGLKPGYAPAHADCIRLVQDLSETFRTGLRNASERVGIPWTDVLTSLVASYCRRISGCEETVVGIPFMGRMGNPSARVPMIIMNVLPLRISKETSAQPETTKDAPPRSIIGFIQQTAKKLVQSRRHGRYRSEQMRRDSGILGGQRRLYGPIINLQPFYRSPSLYGTKPTLEILSTGPVDDINIGFRGDAVSMFDLEIEANPGLYSQEEIHRHSERLVEYLSAAFELILDDASPKTIDEIPLCTAQEREKYLFTVNATEHSVPTTTLVALFEKQMQATPDAPALEFEKESLTYAELEKRTRALAWQLIEQGVKSNSIVAVALPRSTELIVALLAIQRAGGAYMPLDLEHPDERLASILESAQPVCVLATPGDEHRFSNRSSVLPTNAWATHSGELSASRPLAVPIQPSDAAYVIYTSGSTGAPKGVVVEHQAIVNRLEWMRTHYDFNPQDRFLQKTPATFDVSVWEFFLPFLTGATLVVAPPKAHQDPVWLSKIIRERSVSTIHFVPSMLSAFLAVPDSYGIRMKRVFCSGEELSADLRDKFHEHIQAELHNLYGPTEAAVDVTYWPASAGDSSVPVPIGFPVWNTRLYILDEFMAPVPAGVPGDLYLGGVQLARGYLNRSDLTAERFLPDPFRPGERIYKTGDIAKWREDGAVVFLGRSDHQVKIRGLRIELGEIETAIHSVPEIDRAEIVVREDRLGVKRLVAYCQGSRPLDFDSLRTRLHRRLPDYMVPAAFVQLQEWPVTSNGKLDRRRLPPPTIDSQGATTPLRSNMEKEIAQLFTEVLELDMPLGGESDFFTLGGDSLLAVHLLLAIQKRWSIDPGLESIFTTPTVAGLSDVLENELSGASTDQTGGLSPVVKLASGAAGCTPLFVIHPAGGICWNYRELANRLTPRRDVYGLQSPSLDPSRETPVSIDALAVDYTERIVAIVPSGTIHLLGWSVGGIIAQGIAIELQKRGREVGVLALLDAYPSDCWRSEPEPDSVTALRALLAIAGEDPDRHQDLDTKEKIIGFLRKSQSPLGHLSETALHGVVRAVTSTNRLVREHYHHRFNGRLIHLRAGRDHTERPHLQSQLWEPYAVQVDAVNLPYFHAELTGRNASIEIAPRLDVEFHAFERDTAVRN